MAEPESEPRERRAGWRRRALAILLCVSTAACTSGAPMEPGVATPNPEAAPNPEATPGPEAPPPKAEVAPKAAAVPEVKRAPSTEAPERAWAAVKSAHFQLIGDAGSEVLRGVALDLERFRSYLVEIGVALEASYALQPRIFLLTDAWPYWDRLSPSAREGTTLFSTRQGPYVVLKVSLGTSPGEQPTVPLASLHHAYLHATVSDNRAIRLPIWYEEGLAEYLSSFRVDDLAAIEVGIPVAQRVAQMRVGDWVPLDQLFASRRLHGLPTDQAWITTHYLGSTPRHEQLTRYLRLYDEGQPSDAAYRESFEVDYAQLLAEVGAYGAQGDYPYARLEADEIPSPPALEARELTRVQAQLLLADLFARGHGAIAQPEEATALTETLLDRAIAENPDSAWAYAGLAALRMGQERRRDAQALLEQAVTLDPLDSQVHALWGHWLLGEAFARDEGSDERGRLIHEARLEYRFAMDRSPTEAEAFVGLGESYLRSGEKDPEGLDSLEAASLLLPLDLDVLRMLAEMQVSYGNVPLARANLERVASRSESAELRAAANRRLAELAPASAQP